jgi:hypothetical protein
MFSVLSFRINYIFIIIVVSFIFEDVFAVEFSSRKNFNKLLNGFYKNDLYQCRYISKSWSTGFKQHPYGMVVNDGAFKNVLVFNNKGVIGTLWPNIGEISVDRGVRKYQLWKKINSEEYELLNSDFLEDNKSADVNVKGNVISEYKTYFSSNSLKISIKPWITDFYSCEIIESSNFAKKKLIDIFVNQNNYVKKDFAYREKNPSLFSNKIELLPN